MSSICCLDTSKSSRLFRLAFFISDTNQSGTGAVAIKISLNILVYRCVTLQSNLSFALNPFEMLPTAITQAMLSFSDNSSGHKARSNVPPTRMYPSRALSRFGQKLAVIT